MADVDQNGGAGGATQGVPAPPLASLPGGPTSLVPNRTNGVQRRCPKIDHDRVFWVNVWTGEKRAHSCGTNDCPFCGPRNAWKKSLIISHGGTTGPPKRYAVLTQFPHDWQKGRQKMRNLPRYLERAGFPGWQQAWTIEPNPKGTGYHVNVLQKGPYVPQEALQECWGSIVHIKAIKKPRGSQKANAERVAAYSLKEAQKVAGYSVKNAAGGPGATGHLSHLRLNGGRLVHLSRGYLGGLTQDETWQAIQGEREDEGWRLVTG